MAATQDPGAAIRAAIADHGPIGFDEYMELALYGPGGYYERPPVGPAGDFVTSPHVHPVFGELLATGIRELFALLGRPDPFALVEVGAGDGTLARQLLDQLGDLPLRFTVVERSAGAREVLAAIDGLVVRDTVPGHPHLVLGHELLDNLPFRLVRGNAEIRVGTDGGRLVDVPAPIPSDIARHADDLEPGEERAIPTGAIAMLRDLAPRLTHGYALFVDYGGDEGAGGPMHGYAGHRVVQDVLAHPGATDITVGVDFGALTREAAELGLETFPTTTQLRALAALGFEDWIRTELAAQGSLLNEGQGIEAVRTWAGRSRATILVSPDRLGRLKWYVVASEGLPRPSFLG